MRVHDNMIHGMHSIIKILQENKDLEDKKSVLN